MRGYFPTGLPLTCRSASCASEFKVSGQLEKSWPEKSSTEAAAVAAVAAVAARRSDGGGFRQENKVTRMKPDHRKSKLGFAFGCDTM